MTIQVTDYTAVVRPVEGDGPRYFEATFREFQRGIVGVGETPQDALECLLDEAPEFFNDVILSGDNLPEPEKELEWESYSGKATIRMPKSLHYKLHMLAEMENVSLNMLMVTGLSWVAENKHCLMRPQVAVTLHQNNNINFDISGITPRAQSNAGNSMILPPSSYFPVSIDESHRV